MQNRPNGEWGFTLIELMIVVAIIAVLASIAIVNLIRSRIETNEAAAIQDLRVVCSAQFEFNETHERFGDFAELTADAGGTGHANFLDKSWSEGVRKSGYVFSMGESGESSFVCYADPASPGRTGLRYFRVDATGTIRASTTGRPSETDAVVGSAAYGT